MINIFFVAAFVADYSEMAANKDILSQMSLKTSGVGASGSVQSPSSVRSNGCDGCRNGHRLP